MHKTDRKQLNVIREATQRQADELDLFMGETELDDDQTSFLDDALSFLQEAVERIDSAGTPATKGTHR